MKKNVGLWIDHRQAVIVIELDQDEECKRIISGMEKQIRYSGASHACDASEAQDGHSPRFIDHPHDYYDKGISWLRDVGPVLILCPGEADFELQ